MSRTAFHPPAAHSQGFTESLRVLIVEHSTADAELIQRELQNAGFRFRADVVATPEEFAARLRETLYHVVLADFRLPNWTGLDALESLQQQKKDIPFVLVTGTLGEEAAVDCIKKGATDYVLKDRLARLPVAVRRALEEKALREERKRSEEALRHSEARYRELVENATYGIFRVTRAGKFLDVNPALVQMLGYESSAELISADLPATPYRHLEDRSRIIEQCLQSGRVDGVEVEWRREDGSFITVQFSGRAVVDQSGGMEEVEFIVEDVTERRAMEKHLRQVHKFEAIGQMAGGIAHDFNNVIGAIMGWAELGQEQTPADSRLHSHFKKIREQAERAVGLTRQLLAFARRQVLEPRNLNLNQIIVDFVGLLGNILGDLIELRTVAAPDLGVIRADPTQLERVLMNLCLNARDAMPQGGQLLIQTENVTLDEDYARLHTYVQPGRYVRLSVSDTGVGMDAATIEHIFEPFFTTKELGKGTGLGLATVYGVAKQHGGFVQVESRLGLGATFQVYFPLVEGALEDIERVDSAAAQPVQGGSETILVAEDHDGVREMARVALESLGYRLILAQDGLEAVDLFHQHCGSIDLALLDVVMPRMGGPDAYLKMCALKPNLPVLFTTGYIAEAASLQALVEKGAGVLLKPYTPTLLGRRVREILVRASGAAGPSRASARLA